MSNKSLLKTVLCENFKEGIQDSCKYGDRCIFAHGKKEIKKKKCLFELNCYKGSKEHINEYCHPQNWNYENNKSNVLCKNYIEEKCLKGEDCLFIHKIDLIDDKNLKINYKSINLNDEFPKLNNNFESKVIISDKKFSECLKSNFKEDKFQ